ncbi:MAG: TRAP transporter large permease [Eubacteriales bacterium]|nr:TRAP transporter large permease [Eubacteriales bacterium]
MLIGMLFGSLFLLLFLGVPIGTSLGVAAALTMYFTGNNQYLNATVTRLFTQVDNFVLMAIPFFILAGNIMAEGGISKRLISFFEIVLKAVPGRLSIISVVASAFFGAISGSNPATVAAIGGITAPRMLEKGYPRDKVAAIAASAGTLGVVIPPSIPMVTYAVTADQSILKMFQAGWVPGIMLALALCITNVITCRSYDEIDRTKYTGKDYLIRFKDALLALLMPVIILGGIYAGIFTPTESAAVACVYALIVSSVVYHELTFKILFKIFLDSVVSAACVLFVVAMSSPFAWFMTSEDVPTIICNAALALFSNRFVMLFVINIILLFLGCFLETQSIILLVTPILLPLCGFLGISPVALGLIIIVNTSIGMITPPMAVNLFVAAGITGSTIGGVSKKILLYLGIEFGVLLLYTYIPAITGFSLGAG